MKKYKLREFVEAYNLRCGIPDLTPEQVSGINIDKEFFEPAKQVGEDTSSYKIVPSSYFACNLMHVGRDNVLPIAMNYSKNDKYVSPAYSVFKLKSEDIILKEYFYILLKSSEKDRLFAFHTDSSIRQGLPWEDFCDIDITLPSIQQQRKYVDVYLALQSNLAAYQSKVDELKLVCDGYIEELRRKFGAEPIGPYIRSIDVRNTNLSVTLTQGVDVNMQFITAKREAEDQEGTKIVRTGQFAFNKVVKSNGTKLPIALREGPDCVISSSYEVFEVVNKDVLLPEYLMLWLSRSETHRQCGYKSYGTTRDVFPFEDLCKLQFPIPNIETQNNIANIYKCYIERQRIAEALKEQLRNICPVLIRGSLTE
ncbi:MAG: restriction endonuclease subunit S [Bacteroidales bacterium]|nr:restriction endonuclease subunit S [Bacteroidales bacterium]